MSYVVLARAIVIVYGHHVLTDTKVAGRYNNVTTVIIRIATDSFILLLVKSSIASVVCV